MEHFDLVEKLVGAFGVSYEQAKAALEKCDWDAAEAAVLIERQLRGSAAEEAQSAPEEPAQEKAAAGETYTAAAEPETREQGNPQPDPKATQWKTVGTEDFKKFRKSVQRQGSGILHWIFTFLSKNQFVVKKSDGQLFLELPIWLTAVLLIAAFWPVVFILGIVFVMGYRFSFEGPQLGKDAVKKVVTRVEATGETILRDIKKKGMTQPADQVQHSEVPPSENNPSSPE